MSYNKHVFFCTNQRTDGRACCANHNSKAMRGYVKDRMKALGLHQPGKVHVNSAGCLGMCDQGPVIVIYPQGSWYRWVDREDIDEIIESDILQDKVVERLLIKQS